MAVHLLQYLVHVHVTVFHANGKSADPWHRPSAPPGATPKRPCYLGWAMTNDAEIDDLPDTEAEWRERLSDEEYEILREQGTEPRGSGEYLSQKADGTYACAGCGADLFESETKYESGSGWPSFWDAVDDDRIETRPDDSLGMTRTEIVCARCGGHLGHVFDDGPDPTGKRYCVNSLSLEFDPEE